MINVFRKEIFSRNCKKYRVDIIAKGIFEQDFRIEGFPGFRMSLLSADHSNILIIKHSYRFKPLNTGFFQIITF